MARAAAPVAAVVAVAVGWLIAGPGTADLAAHSYRSWLWDAEGFAVFNAQWYGGHHVPGYSMLFPPLASWLGVRLAVALAGVAAAAMLVALARSIEGERRDLAAWLLAAGAAANMVVGRGPFVLGVALGAAALLMRDRLGWSAFAAAACTAASPVAGMFLALIGVSLRAPALAIPPLLVGGSLALLFPEGGAERFGATAFWPMFALTAAAVWLLPGRTLRAAGALYLALLAGAFLVDTPVGQNAVRLGALAIPAALVMAGRGPRAAVIGVTVAMIYLQMLPAVRAVGEAWGDPSTKASFYAPLLEFLERSARPGDTVEVVFTKNHWEAAYVAPHFALARGWERQLDLKHNGLFYEDGPISLLDYRRWLARQRVQWIALPDAPLDFSGESEAITVRTSVASDVLREVARLPGWRVFRTEQQPSALTGAGPTELELRAPRAGVIPVGRRHTRYWRVVDGDACPVNLDGWLGVEARGPGRVRLQARFQPFGDRCGPG